MSHYAWGEPTAREKRAGVLLAADTEDGTRLLFSAEVTDADILAEFAGITVSGETFTSGDTEDWPKVERYIPRVEWPEEIYAGRKGPAERRPDPAIADAVAKARADLAELLAVGNDE